jgi:hypothetical protein
MPAVQPFQFPAGLLAMSAESAGGVKTPFNAASGRPTGTVIMPNTYPGITPGPFTGHAAIVASSTFRCCATSARGVWVSQLESDTS